MLNHSPSIGNRDYELVYDYDSIQVQRQCEHDG